MSVSKSEQDMILHTIVQQIQQRYVLPDVAKQVSEKLLAMMQQHSIGDLADPHLFMQRINSILANYSNDPHLRLLDDPQGAKGIDREQVLAKHFERARHSNFGFIEAKRLTGNIGYIDIRELPPREVAGDIAAGMLAAIAHTAAIILDLRANEGGTASMVQFLASYFVDEQPRPLSGVYSRADSNTSTSYTLAQIPGQRLDKVPLFVLVSGATFSAGEALAYDLQALKRALVIGEPTRGGAHLSTMLPIADTYMLRLPTERAVHPTTRSNWEGCGVQPSIKCAAVDALTIAQRTALTVLLKRAESDSDKAFYQWELETFEATQQPFKTEVAQWQNFAGDYGEWRIMPHADYLSAQHHTAYRLLPLSQNTFIVNDETRLRFDADELVVLYRAGGEEHFHRDR